MEGNEKGRIEAILFVAGDAVEIRDLARALGMEEKAVQKVLKELQSEYDYEQRGFLLKRFGTKVQLATRPLYAEDVVRLLQPVQRQSLSQAAMETLAVVAYKQPVTRAEVEQIRGVKCDYSIQSLMNKGLIREALRVAQTRNYNGIYAICQDNNLDACRFYLGTGFAIGGFDNRIYRGTNQADKANIFFYLDSEEIEN